MALTESFEFETIVTELLQANGFRIDRNLSASGIQVPFDLVAIRRDERWAVEVKYYKTARAQVRLVRTAAAVLVSGLFANRLKGLLIISSILPPEVRETLEGEFGIVIASRDELLTWAAKAPHLMDRLNSILESETSAANRLVGRPLEYIDAPVPLAAPETPPPPTTGADLCDELRQLPRGRPKWRAYEKLCERILQYLFVDDLHGWHKQKRTDDGLNRFDFICRVRRTTEFWEFLIDHLGTRYVLFEFKNYAYPIKQGQVLTTEKYLLEKGLRRTGILFTRAGADTDAQKMINGAMREHGKLMLVVHDDQVCEMLHMRDRGEDPSDLLFAIADEFLLALSR